jgi:hypothetical protein
MQDASIDALGKHSLGKSLCMNMSDNINDGGFSRLNMIFIFRSVSFAVCTEALTIVKLARTRQEFAHELAFG